jgi:hypothetical protein
MNDTTLIRSPLHPKTRAIIAALERMPMRLYDIPDIAREQLAERRLTEQWRTDIGTVWVRLADHARRA